MGRKRSLVDSNNDVKKDQQESKKLKKDNAANTTADSEKEYGINISVSDNLSINADKQLFDNFADAVDILVGKNITIMYKSKEEAKMALRNVKNLRVHGEPVWVQLCTHNKDKIVAKVELSNVPETTEVPVLKELYPEAHHINVKRIKDKKVFIALFSSEDEAKKACSRTVTVKGQKVTGSLLPMDIILPPKESFDETTPAKKTKKRSLKLNKKGGQSKKEGGQPKPVPKKLKNNTPNAAAKKLGKNKKGKKVNEEA